MLTGNWPGVYIEETNSTALSVPSGASVIPVFVGVFKGIDKGERYPLNDCVRVNNWLDFTANFIPSPDYEVAVNLKSTLPPYIHTESQETNSSEPTAQEIDSMNPGKSISPGDHRFPENHAVDYSLNMALATAVVDTAVLTYTPYLGSFAVQHYFDNGGGACYVFSYDETKDVSVLASAIKRNPEISLLCYCEMDSDLTALGDIEAQFSLLLQKNPPSGYFYIADAYRDTRTGMIIRPITEPTQTAVYYPALQTMYTPVMPAESTIFVTITPDILGDGGRYSLSSLQESENPLFQRVYQDLLSVDVQAACGTYSGVSTAIQAEHDVMYPDDSPYILLKSSAAIAGVYASTERDFGVWKAPANIQLRRVNQVSVVGLPIPEDDTPEGLYENRINPVKNMANRGIFVMGARTFVDPAGSDASLWLYVSVRLLFNAVERDIKNAVQTVVFEKNNALTWEVARGAVASYLHTIWLSGGLTGTVPEEAYFVNIGRNITMTDDDINQGRLIMRVGMAAVRPSEFIILQFSQDIVPL